MTDMGRMCLGSSTGPGQEAKGLTGSLGPASLDSEWQLWPTAPNRPRPPEVMPRGWVGLLARRQTPWGLRHLATFSGDSNEEHKQSGA